MSNPYGQQGGHDPYGSQQYGGQQYGGQQYGGQQYGGQQYGSGSYGSDYPSNMPQPQQTPYPQAGYPYGGWVQKQTHTLAIVSLICSLAGCATGISSFAGIITGHMARKRIRENPNAYEGEGMALAGLIVGYVLGTFVVLYAAFLITMFIIAFLTAPHH